jgi:hypothetical protein
VAKPLPDWPLRARAETLRQWPTIVDVVESAERLPGFAAFVLIGSFAGGWPDEVSDVDSIVSVKDGAFAAAWEARRTLHPSETAFEWDFRPDTEREIGAHKWISRDLVLVECVLATPIGHARLADPFVVLAGDPAYVETFNRIEQIKRSELEEYVRRLRAEGHDSPEVQKRYGGAGERSSRSAQQRAEDAVRRRIVHARCHCAAKRSASGIPPLRNA